jgi:hypothetical protein
MAKAMDAIINLVKLFKTSVQLVALTEYKAVSVNVFRGGSGNLNNTYK